MSALELEPKDKLFYENILKEGTREEKETVRLSLAEKYYSKDLMFQRDNSQNIKR